MNKLQVQTIFKQNKQTRLRLAGGMHRRPALVMPTPFSNLFCLPLISTPGYTSVKV